MERKESVEWKHLKLNRQSVLKKNEWEKCRNRKKKMKYVEQATTSGQCRKTITD